MNIIIDLRSPDTRILDSSVQKIAASVPANEYGTVTIQVAPVVQVDNVRLLARRIVFTEPTDKAVKALSKIDVPLNVEISVR